MLLLLLLTAAMLEGLCCKLFLCYAEWTNISSAPFFDPVKFKKQVFLLNSKYVVSTGASDAEAFDKFRDVCMSVGEIHRDDLTKGVLPVHPVSKMQSGSQFNLQTSPALC